MQHYAQKSRIQFFEKRAENKDGLGPDLKCAIIVPKKFE